MPFCRECGTEVSATMKFCPECLAPQVTHSVTANVQDSVVAGDVNIHQTKDVECPSCQAINIPIFVCKGEKCELRICDECSGQFRLPPASSVFSVLEFFGWDAEAFGEPPYCMPESLCSEFEGDLRRSTSGRRIFCEKCFEIEIENLLSSIQWISEEESTRKITKTPENIQRELDTGSITFLEYDLDEQIKFINWKKVQLSKMKNELNSLKSKEASDNRKLLILTFGYALLFGYGILQEVYNWNYFLPFSLDMYCLWIPFGLIIITTYWLDWVGDELRGLETDVKSESGKLRGYEEDYELKKEFPRLASTRK